ncbi:BMP family ABC transporter substrate-binding protein [Alkalicoccus luteus]|uniref:BMP family ABC transporter substrate-binding protein n=1 Tax=Alkalicoccus luteus TaxID=1237094 RepID=A0A969TWT9_9BACI|nr:BMP family ABC transporter substrate-binding protein [Alkalicoccus luteus]
MKQFLFVALLLITSACASAEERDRLEVGLLLTHPIEEQEWNRQGYEGVLQLQSDFDAEVHVMEGVTNFEETANAVEQMAEEGVNLLFGHGSIYSDMFLQLNEGYEDIHFISFNESASAENVSSMHFEGYAMGYFAGMLAAEQSASGHIAVIGAFPYQPEVQAFAEGARWHNPDIQVSARMTESWVDEGAAVGYLDELADQDADVFYTAGDGFSEAAIERAAARGAYVIGYVTDQSSVSPETVLTSTLQHVDELYLTAADRFRNGTLEPGRHSFDFAEEAISLAPYGPAVEEETRKWMNDVVQSYAEDGKLPHESQQEEE